MEKAFWVMEPGRGAIREEPLGEPGESEVRVRTAWSGVSRGTESLVFRGRVPVSERERMRAPFQVGDFPGPVKYGYLNVGVVQAGDPDLVGRAVFSLAPHQTASVLPLAGVTPIPDGIPVRRAVLTGMVETAVNALWDVPVLVGDRVTVVGAGVLGCCVARLAARQAGARVTLVDVDPRRASVAEALGVGFASPASAAEEQDVVFHTSATGAGLASALGLLRTEGTVADLSWYGDATVSLPLGAAFHSRRLTIRASQVGVVAPARRSGRTTAERLALAVELLEDDAFDVLLTGRTPFADLPALLAGIADGSVDGLCHTISYGTE